MKTIVLGHDDTGVAARPLGAPGVPSVPRPWVSSAHGALGEGRVLRPAVSTLTTDPTLDPTTARTT